MHLARTERGYITLNSLQYGMIRAAIDVPAVQFEIRELTNAPLKRQESRSQSGASP